MTASNIIIAGGSGYIGRTIAPFLVKHGRHVTILTRNPSAHGYQPGIKEVLWDGRTPEGWWPLLNQARAVINLTGKSVNCRYHQRNRQEIVSSRVHSVEAIASAYSLCDSPPPVWIQASSLAIYGDAGERWCTEESGPGEGFPVETCLLWEKAFEEASLGDTRKVVLRLGLAIGLTEGTNNGILGTLLTLVKLGLGGHVGSGRQYISWIHTNDLNQLVLEMISEPRYEGVYNIASPHPVTNAELMQALRKALHRFWSPPVPALIAKWGAWLMRTEASLALTGRRGCVERLLATGFQFQYLDLATAFCEMFPGRVSKEGGLK